MSQAAQNQIVALTLAVESHITAPVYYERIIVTNETTDDVYVSTNGTAVAKTAGNFGAVILPGAWRMIGNDQPRQPLVSTTKPGSTVQGALTPLPSGSPTYVSLLANASGNVAVEFV